ncbi:MAG TPA: class I SAM-dependent methyltransferase [Thermoplasmata archaeon]|nr:class I SAM-dependent methyltransferase [Thermoplasmata archaeon]
MTDPDGYRAAMESRYASGETPWDSGRPSHELVRRIEAGDLPGHTILEIGCGTGTNAVELARRGYQVTAVDLVELAVRKGREKARAAGVEVAFHLGDVTRLELGGPFDCVFDSGVYHGIRMRALPEFLAALTRLTRRGSRWLSLAGNATEITPNGPPVVTESEFRNELGGIFEIVDVRTFRFDLAPDFQPLAWSILLRRR